MEGDLLEYLQMPKKDLSQSFGGKDKKGCPQVPILTGKKSL